MTDQVEITDPLHVKLMESLHKLSKSYEADGDVEMTHTMRGITSQVQGVLYQIAIDEYNRKRVTPSGGVQHGR